MPVHRSILVASRNPAVVAELRRCFDAGTRLQTANDPETARALLARGSVDALFIDLDLLHPEGQAKGREAFRQDLQPFWRAAPGVPLIVMTPAERVRDAVEAVQAGADNYLSVPVVPEEVRYVLRSLNELRRFESELSYLRDAFWSGDQAGIAQTKSPAMKQVFDKAKAAAPTPALVLLTGETGTGKSVIARLIHDHSQRKDKPFISVHCGAIPDTLIESELFGHEKGAFTGATARKLGRFELAQGGTIFLDEIGTMGQPAQVKLLQVLQDKTFQRVGGETTLRADVRVIAATNLDLKAMVERGEFRSDLYYRLHVFPIEIPPLRERKEDIPLLVATFLARLGAEYLKEVREVDQDALDALQAYHWPGNVRELENIIERAYILEGTTALRPGSFPAELMADGAAADPRMPVDTTVSLRAYRERAKDDAEQRYLREVLARNRGRIDATARHAGITTRQLHKLLTRHGIHKEEFK